MPRNSAMYFRVVAGMPIPPKLLTTDAIHETYMIYPILDGPKTRAIAIEVKIVTMKPIALSRPYQPVFLAIVLVFDISA